ncbi:MAG: SDR family NAD(P)-dependent oxidoreductase [Betaproteobacteria bacterium]
MMDLYIVTGASRGLGLAFARQLAADPAHCVLGISRAGVPAGVAAWRDLRVDLGTRSGLAAGAAGIVAAFAAQSWTRAVLINNAGMIEPLGIRGRIDAARLQQNIAVNLIAPMVLMNAFLGASMAVPARSVINISSGSGRRPMAGSGAYCAAKAGLDMASRVAALEEERTSNPARITSLAPGIIETDMQVAARNAKEEEFPEVARFRAFKSEGLLKSADEVARKIILLDREGKLPAGIADVREIS